MLCPTTIPAEQLASALVKDPGSTANNPAQQYRGFALSACLQSVLSLASEHIVRKMAFKRILTLVSVLACVAGGLAVRISHPAVIANRPAEHAASQPAAALSLAAAQVGVLLMQGMRPGARLLTAVVWHAG